MIRRLLAGSLCALTLVVLAGCSSRDPRLPTWVAYCLVERKQVSRTTQKSDEATKAKLEHQKKTGHAVSVQRVK